MATVFRRFIEHIRLLMPSNENIPNAEARLAQVKEQLRELDTQLTATDQRALYAVIGQALTAWAKMEQHMVLIAALLLQVRAEQAGLVMYSIINFNTWRTLIHDLYEMNGSLKQFQSRWNKISERITKIKDTRDQLAHYSVEHDEPRASLRAPSLNATRKARMHAPLSNQEITNFTEKVLNIADDLAELYETMEIALLTSQENPPVAPLS